MSAPGAAPAVQTALAECEAGERREGCMQPFPPCTRDGDQALVAGALAGLAAGLAAGAAVTAGFTAPFELM